MDWEEFGLARQLLVEEGPGKSIRQAKASEDAEYQATLKAMTKRG